MSRIHDALRRAEREKRAAELMEDAARSDPHAVPEDSYEEGSPSAAGDNRAATQHGESEAARDALAVLKALEERCAHHAWQPDPEKMLFVDGQDHAVGTEEFRTLRSHLYLIRDRQPLQKLLITSPLPQDGKSFVAVNLARVISRHHDHRVLLIDADLRLSQLHHFVGTSAAPGLSDYLAGDFDEFSVVQRGPLDNLYFIPGGRPVPNPSELIGFGRLRVLLNRLGPAFDWIILDSPPAVPVSDARLMADLCDGVLMVVRSGATPFDLAQKACRDLRERRLLGVVLNQADAGKAYGYYYSYGGKEDSGNTRKAKPGRS